MDDRVEVTNENFGELLIEGLKEALAVERGELEPARIVRRKLTARKTTATVPPAYDARKISRIRKNLGVSQPVFAQMLGVQTVTVQKYEEGKNTPIGPVRRLLEIAERRPEVLTATLEASSKPAPGQKQSKAGE